MDGDSRTHTAYALFSIASIIEPHRENQRPCATAPLREPRGASHPPRPRSPLGLDDEHRENAGGDQRAERHDHRDRGRAEVALRTALPARFGASTDPPRPTPTAKPVPNARTCVGNAFANSAYMPGDRAVREETCGHADHDELHEVGRSTAEQRDHDRRHEHHADRDELDVVAHREQPDDGAAGRAADVQPAQHLAGGARSEAHVDDDRRHLLHDEVERRDVEEVRDRDDDRDRQQAAAENVPDRALAHVGGDGRQRRDRRMADLACSVRLIFSSAPSGCLRASQCTDSGMKKYTIGMKNSVTPAPNKNTERQFASSRPGRRDEPAEPPRRPGSRST